jgi:hypothetical protein
MEEGVTRPTTIQNKLRIHKNLHGVSYTAFLALSVSASVLALTAPCYAGALGGVGAAVGGAVSGVGGAVGGGAIGGVNSASPTGSTASGTAPTTTAEVLNSGSPTGGRNPNRAVAAGALNTGSSTGDNGSYSGGTDVDAPRDHCLRLLGNPHRYRKDVVANYTALLAKIHREAMLR